MAVLSGNARLSAHPPHPAPERHWHLSCGQGAFLAPECKEPRMEDLSPNGVEGALLYAGNQMVAVL